MKKHIIICVLILFSCNSKKTRKSIKNRDNISLIGNWKIDSMINVNDLNAKTIVLISNQGYSFEKSDSAFLFKKQNTSYIKIPQGKFIYSNKILHLIKDNHNHQEWFIQKLDSNKISMKANFNYKEKIRPHLFLSKII